MWHRRIAACMGLLLMGAAGCASTVVGAWGPATPDVAEGQFSSMQFRDDGSFSAVTVRGGEEALLSGKYDFDGVSLTLKPPGKAEKRYRATYIMGGELQLNGDGVQQKLLKK